MAAFKRKDRPNEGYRIWPTLPKPWGRIGPFQTGFRTKRQADDVEAWVFEMARTRPELIDALVAGTFTVREAWIAKLRGTLDNLIAGLSDPMLTDAVEEYRGECSDDRARAGLNQLLEYADPDVRLSWLAGKNIRAVYRRAIDAGRKPNSIRRSLYRAVAELLAYHLKEAGREAAMKEVPVPGEDDVRVVRVTGPEINRALEECVPMQFRLLALAAIVTAVDQGPLLLMTPRHINETDGTASIPDTKTAQRARTILLGDIALQAFRLAALGKGPDERLWPWTKDQVRHYWEAARDKAAGRPTRGLRRYRGRAGNIDPLPDPAGDAAARLLADQHVVTLPVLRFKDLRHVLPTLLAELKIDRRNIQEYIGHARGSKQTDRYITPTGDVAWLNAAAARLGLTNATLRVG